ncbi:MAG: hypothetical protein Q4C99_01700 [Clostridia bacterium]|nr:hypothetical protein [Clostridia bacterium]
MIFFFSADLLIVIGIVIFIVIALFTVGLTGMCNWALENPGELSVKLFLILLAVAFLTALIASDNGYGIRRFIHCMFISVPASLGLTVGLLYCIYLICGYVTASDWDELAIFFFIWPMLQIFFILLLCLVALGLGALIGVLPAFLIDDVSKSAAQSVALSALASLIPSGVLVLIVHLINSGLYKIFFLVTY